MQPVVDPHDLTRATAIRTARQGRTRNDHKSARHRKVSAIMTSDRSTNRNSAQRPAPDDEPRCGACGHARRMHMNDRSVCFECRPASNWRPHAGWCNRYRKLQPVVRHWRECRRSPPMCYTDDCSRLRRISGRIGACRIPVDQARQRHGAPAIHASGPRHGTCTRQRRHRTTVRRIPLLQQYWTSGKRSQCGTVRDLVGGG